MDNQGSLPQVPVVGKQQYAQPEQIVYEQPATTGIETDAYAPDDPNGELPQQQPGPEPPPAPQSWNLAQVTPAGTVQCTVSTTVKLVV